MAAKIAFVCALALFGQVTFGQTIGPGSYVSGNSVVDNNIVIGAGSSYGAGGYAFGAENVGLAIGSGSAGYAVGGSSAGLALGSGLGLSSGGLSRNLGSIGVAAPVVGTTTVGGLAGLNVVSGGPLAITAISPIGPSGLAVASENAIEGNLLVTGQLPFLSAVAFEGALPTAGSGVATCGCGSGTVGITSEGFGRSMPWY